MQQEALPRGLRRCTGAAVKPYQANAEMMIANLVIKHHLVIGT